MSISYTTYKKHIIDFENFNDDLIDIDDIAHALSLTCRFGGQCDYFYSVAQHSINCYKKALHDGLNDILLYALLYDASEAYMCDIPSPLKKLIPEYKRIENIVSSKIFNKYCGKDIDTNIHDTIKKIDNDIFEIEYQVLMNNGKNDYDYLNFDYQKQIDIEKEFINCFNEIKEDFND